MFVSITVEAFMAEEELETYPFERDPETGYMKALSTEDLVDLSPRAQDRIQNAELIFVERRPQTGPRTRKSANSLRR